MELININPFIRYARLHRNTQNINTDLKLCYDCRLFLITQGHCKIEINCKIYELTPGCVIYLPPASRYHFFETKKNTDFFVLNFDLTDGFTHIKHSLRTPLYANHDKNKIHIYDLPDSFKNPLVKKCSNISKQINEICENFLTKKPYYRELSSAILKECLIKILAQSDELSSSGIAYKVLDYIYKNYSSPSLDNNEIASHFGYHPYYLSSIIKEVTGKTLHKQLLDFRLSSAMNMLVATDYDITTISWKCGFNSVSYFISSFKEKTGTTPKQYRKMTSII